MKASRAVFIVAVPLALMGFKNGYHLETKQIKRGYLVNVVNNTPANLQCYLSTNNKRPKKIIIPSYSKSQKFIFDLIPKLTCKAI